MVYLIHQMRRDEEKTIKCHSTMDTDYISGARWPYWMYDRKSHYTKNIKLD